MNDNIRKNILTGLITRDNAHNGYYEKLGLSKLINDALRISNVSVLNKIRNKLDVVDGLIKNYQIAGNDLNNQEAFEELQVKVNSIFRLKFNFVYIVIFILIILAIIIF